MNEPGRGLSPREAVFDHLRGIARRVQSASGDLAALRAVIADYGRLNSVVSACTAKVTETNLQGMAAEWVVSDTSDPDRRLLYVHGGSWLAGSARSYRSHTARLARVTGCCVLAIDYRLAPENPYPAAIDDCVTALRWLQEYGPHGTGAPRQCFVAGDSAGGNLVLGALLKAKLAGHSLPQAAVLLSPATDLTWGSASLRTRAHVDPVLAADRLPALTEVYLQQRAAADSPCVSPVFADLAGLPPLLIQVGDAEILLDDSIRLATAAAAQGVPASLSVWPHMPHVFQLFAPCLPEADEALAAIADFVRYESNDNGPAMHRGT